jgi:hypothetical protein
MSHNYLLDLNQHIATRITTLTARSAKAGIPPEECCRIEGRLEVLKEFQSLLCRHYYPKLPKRLYRRLAVSACEAPAAEI